ncbi:alpha-keto acid decarboxylase family protein [Ligilactobacillus pobuzihii]|uniref:Alpha-keto-acid decarboxylase n=1 Tax=Ligilactobacillus pobuzihii TaxID=449659 RepID=A0A0R2LS13_9LACO|nr:thiamine pyrophosphate-binding protein [Ligilactobacillus pobuzihii]KRK10298.1 branched-chain alpha-ketoacid decarboxylase [Ligilactobacillus pobuzihii E100301 = KCTC 13174]KRO02029.1 branched-chain alpha-ketoacid decarboxylase [Ligilactobacillus pobuzihii]GEN48215.1 pyruvate decarboxylase [Ligilactobacillus pobuzihii]
MYTVGDYLLDVVHALGTDKVFGVPGDYNLQFLDHITARNDMKWIGDANELNAAYLTDGYARKNGFGALVTTFGVGELSALNGLAGAMSEHVPVLEIVGSPRTNVQKDQQLVHHTSGDGDFLKFEEAHKALGFDVYHLTKENAIDQIDSMVRTLVATKKPAYVVLPLDLGDVSVNPALKDKIAELTQPVKQDVSTSLLAEIGKYLSQAAQPLVLVGHEVARFGLENEVQKLITDHDLPFIDNGLSKGTLSEDLSQFAGTYNGELSPDTTKRVVDQADVVLLLGAKITDSVSGSFTQSFTDNQIIAINANVTSVFGRKTRVDFRSLIEELAKFNFTTAARPSFKTVQPRTLPTASDHLLTQEFYDQAVEASLQPGQTLLAEQGTSYFGLTTQPLPKDAKFIGQPLWGSIGYTFPAALGSQIADPLSRNVLSIGEGSLQMTLQEFGLAFRENLHSLILLIENDGYTVERYIHGMDQSYNNVPAFDYDQVPRLFGASDDQAVVLNARTENELLVTLKKAQEMTDKLVLVRVHMAQKDAPEVLEKMVKM